MEVSMETTVHHGRVATAPRGLNPKNLCEKKQCYLYTNRGMFAEALDDFFADLHTVDSLWDRTTTDTRGRDNAGKWDFNTCFNNGCICYKSKIDLANDQYYRRRSR